MKILTSKNGIALVAVLTVLLILTLLLPAMFTMTESATISSKKAQTEQKASYFARTSAEMTVMAFEEFYEKYEYENDAYLEKVANNTDPEKKPEKPQVCKDYDTFVSNKSMKANVIYIYSNDSWAGKEPPPEVEDEDEEDEDEVFENEDEDESEDDFFDGQEDE